MSALEKMNAVVVKAKGTTTTPPLLLLHGIGNGSWVWERDQQAMAEAGFSSWAVDLPGHGESKGSSSNSIEYYGQFLIKALEPYELKDLSLCGHSMGGLIALDMVLNHNFEAKELILVNSIYPTRVADALLAKAKMGNGGAANFIIKYGLYRRLLGMRNAFSEADDLVMLDDLDACNNYELDLNDIKNAEIPISIILGSKDRLVDLKAVENFTDIVPSQTYTMDEVGHFSFFEDPVELSRLISTIV